MKTIKLAGCVICLAFGAAAQDTGALRIEQCYEMATLHYPLVKQRELLKKSREYSVSNAAKGYLPQLNINGQATYQSDVITLPVSIPGVSISSPDKDQYKIYGEINQPLTDLLTVKQQKELANANSAVQEQNLEVEIYKIKERVNQLFFSSLLLDEQLTQTSILKRDLQTSMDKITASVANGTALKTNADVLKAEQLKADQRIIELKATRRAYMDMLGLFINQSLNEETKLLWPLNKTTGNPINRPELLLFENQKKISGIQNEFLKVKNLPRLGLFFQSGYAKPMFNPFSNNFDFYYIGGLRLNWSLTGFYTMKKEKALISINQSMIDAQRDLFLFNTNYTLKQQGGEVSKLQELLASDNEIIILRENIKKTAAVQLENGMITSGDYARELNAEDQAKQNLVLHKVQLLMAQYNYQTTSGN